MGAFLLRRTALLVPVVIGITLAVFLLIRLIPGDPARVLLGIHVTPAALAALHKSMGLDQPLAAQYFIFLKALIRGQLGYSYFFDEKVVDLVLGRLAPTLFLIGYATVLTVLIAFPSAIVAALRPNSIWDQAVRFASIFGIGLPSYWLGVVLVYAFAIAIPILPVAGYGETLGQHITFLLLPSLTIAVSLVPLVLRALRASVMETLRAGYVDTARAKGLAWHRVMGRHVVRNALMPAVTVLALNIGYLIGGTVIIENVFAIPGLGALMILSIGTRDYPTIQAVTLMFAILVVLVNLVTDLIYVVLDPRLRAEIR
jgi:ABC-type dipeptide/oligopeptide/nickel transport system permease component